MSLPKSILPKKVEIKQDVILTLISVRLWNFKVGPKKQDVWQKINILKGNHCILRMVRQKLGMILENKVVQKLKLERNVFTKNGLLN